MRLFDRDGEDDAEYTLDELLAETASLNAKHVADPPPGCMCSVCTERAADSFLAKRESNRMFGRNADPALCVPVIYATPTAEPVPCASCASLAAKGKHCWRHV